MGSFGFMYANWIVSSGLGFVLGAQLDDPLSWGLDVAMVVAFIGIVTPLLINKTLWLCAMLSGFIALFTHDLPFQMSILVSSLVAIIISTGIAFYLKKPLKSQYKGL
jgi:predicted branched-subunit amino acid permease